MLIFQIYSSCAVKILNHAVFFSFIKFFGERDPHCESDAEITMVFFLLTWFHFYKYHTVRIQLP